jgi:hypothetical protein
MANMCVNFITITGDDLTKVKELLSEAEQAREGWLPEEILNQENIGRYLFDVSIHEEGDDYINVYCETKWSPPTEELEAIGKLFKVNVTNLYEELGEPLYGTSTFSIETMETTDVFLDKEELGRVTIDEETGEYMLGGEPCESILEAYDEMLQEKIEKQDRTYMVVDISGRGFTTTHTFSQLKNWLGEEMTCDDELAIDVIDDLDVGDKFDCDNIIDSDSFTACHIIRTI